MDSFAVWVAGAESRQRQVEPALRRMAGRLAKYVSRNPDLPLPSSLNLSSCFPEPLESSTCLASDGISMDA